MKAWFLDVSCQADLGGPKQNSQGKVEDRCRTSWTKRETDHRWEFQPQQKTEETTTMGKQRRNTLSFCQWKKNQQMSLANKKNENIHVEVSQNGGTPKWLICKGTSH